MISASLLNTLEEVGLAEKEASVYLALLSLQTATAYEVAQHCDVKKPTVYVILEELRKKGLVLKTPHAKKTLFAAVDPLEYVQEQERRVKATYAALPKLRALGQGSPSGVYVFNGLDGIRQALDYKFDSMRGKTYSSYYSKFVAGNDAIRKMYSEWDNKALAADISFRIVMTKEKTGSYTNEIFDLAEKTDHIDIKLIEKFKSPTVSTEIAETFVRITDEKGEQATIIDNKATADAMRQIFVIVWEKGA